MEQEYGSVGITAIRPKLENAVDRCGLKAFVTLTFQSYFPRTRDQGLCSREAHQSSRKVLRPERRPDGDRRRFGLAGRHWALAIQGLVLHRGRSDCFPCRQVPARRQLAESQEI